MAISNGGIIGPDNIPTGKLGTASGVWKLNDATDYIEQGLWPVATGLSIPNSCRFNDGSSDKLARTPSSNGSYVINTWSFWVKRSSLGADQNLFNAYVSGSNKFRIRFSSNDTLQVGYFTGSWDFLIDTNRVFRDVSAFYNIVIVQNAGVGTSTDRLQVWVNGVRETSFATTTFPDQDEGSNVINSTSATQNIGASGANNAYFDGYMSEVVHIDGTAYSADSFGEFDEDSGIWKPIDVSGLTFGTNGYYLEFKQSGTGTNASGIGADTSGNTNHFAVTNLTATDQSTDTCTNNFATWNPLACAMQNVGNNVTFSEGNLKAVGTSGGQGTLLSTIAVNSGKWYAEFKMIDVADGNYSQVALLDEEGAVRTTGGTGSTVSRGNVTVKPNGDLFIAETRSAGWFPTFTDNDIIQIAADLDNGAFYFGKNGTYSNSGNPESGASKTGAAYAFTASSKLWFFAGGLNTTGSAVSANFGSPSFAISSSNADGDGFGNFEYAVPSGYFALNTKNLAEYG